MPYSAPFLDRPRTLRKLPSGEGLHNIVLMNSRPAGEVHGQKSLQATLEVLGCQVVTQEDEYKAIEANFLAVASTDPGYRNRDSIALHKTKTASCLPCLRKPKNQYISDGLTFYPLSAVFVQDPFKILHGTGVAIHCGTWHRRSFSDHTLRLHKIGYQVVNVKGAYFEGGNLVYVPSKKLLIHGANPVGQYETERMERDNFGRSYPQRCWKVAPDVTCAQLAKTLSPYGITVIDIHCSAYHLDLALNCLPDGRVLGATQHFSPEAMSELRTHLGGLLVEINADKSSYASIHLNALTIQCGRVTYVIAHPFMSPSPAYDADREVFYTKMMDEGIIPVTAECLFSESPLYWPELTERVSMRLKEKGHPSLDEDGAWWEFSQGGVHCMTNLLWKGPASIKVSVLNDKLLEFLRNIRRCCSLWCCVPSCISRVRKIIQGMGADEFVPLLTIANVLNMPLVNRDTAKDSPEKALFASILSDTAPLRKMPAGGAGADDSLAEEERPLLNQKSN